jgi:N-acetylglucosaminyl-diphospho-decaprenol L-rhamnosyltransferase
VSARDRGSERRVSAVVVNYESGHALAACIASLIDQPDLLETIVVDNGSADGSVAAVRERYPELVVVEPNGNLGFAGGANAGARVARGDLLFFLNPDVRVSPGAVEALAAAFDGGDVGVAGPTIDRLRNIELGGTIDMFGFPVVLSRPRQPLYVSGCALMTRAALFDKLGGFDDRFFMFVEDVDYCWRVLLRGRDVRVVPEAAVTHEGGASARGGYVTDEGFSTTAFRVVLRERNALATLLKCYRLPTLAFILPPHLLQSLATAAALAATGRARTARGVVGGLWWNVRQLPRTLELRRITQRSRERSERSVLRRMHRGVQKLTLLREFGVPPVNESLASPPRAPIS